MRMDWWSLSEGATIQIIAWGMALVLLLALYASFRANKVRLLNGMLGTAFIMALGLAVSASVVASQNQFLMGLWAVLVVAVFVILAFFVSCLGLLLLWNAWIVWHRESHSLGNSLTLLLGIYVVLSPWIFRLFDAVLPQWLAKGLQGVSSAFIAYLVFWLISYLMSFLLYVLFQPKLNQEYIIVLGAGLLNGNQISPLLKSRIDVALQFARRQHQATGHWPVIICTGGQGPDETISEGAAMVAYAKQTGYPTQNLLAETEAKNTYQNMAFSKQMLIDHGIPLAKGIFATSDYHVFRAAGYARLVGLPIDGIGAHTSRYFIFNAMLREYVAILMNHKVFHIVCLGLLFVMAFLNAWLATQ